MKNKIQTLKNKRIEETKKIQKKYDKLVNFEEKFAFIYDLLYMNLYPYASWVKKENVFDKQLVLEACKIQTKGEFINFIKEKTINPLNQGHYFMYNRYLEEKEINNKKEINESNFTYSFISENILCLTFETFFSRYLEDDKRKFNILSEELNNYEIKSVILDLRGNCGGSDDYLKEIIKCLRTSLKYKIEWKNMLFDENEFYECDLCFGDNKYDFYLLTDSKVFSAAECMTRAFKQNGAIIIGEQTRGEAGMSPQLELKVLSYFNKDKNMLADLILKIPIEAPINNKGEVDYNYTNTKPTISCDSKDALKIAIAEIKKTK